MIAQTKLFDKQKIKKSLFLTLIFGFKKYNIVIPTFVDGFDQYDINQYFFFDYIYNFIKNNLFL